MKKLKKFLSFSMTLLFLLEIIILPTDKREPHPKVPKDEKSPISVCSPGLGDDKKDRD